MGEGICISPPWVSIAGMKTAGIVVLVVVLAVVAFGLYRTFTPPDDLYTATHHFPNCPERPSCVSSIAKDSTHAIAPLRYEGDPDAAQALLSSTISAMPGARIEQEDEHYIHALFQTPHMHFHDDVELLISPDGVVDVRSISRFGYGDHGVNRARVGEIRKRFEGVKLRAVESPK